MCKVLIGTTNPSKTDWLKTYLNDIPDLQCVTLSELGVTIDVPEEGATPAENALLKAHAYHAATGLSVISHDSGLYFREFAMEDSRQPGLHIRRVNGETLDDDGMMSYYSRLAESYGPLHGCYCSGFCAVDENGNAETFCQDSPIDEQYFNHFGFILCSIPHPKRHPGWPLDSLCKDPVTGSYWFDLPDEEETGDDDYSKSHRNNVKLFYQHFFHQE